MRTRLTALIALAVTACTGWRVQSGPVPQSGKTLNESNRDAIRVRLHNGAEMYMVSAKVVGDSLVGYNRDNREEFARYAVPIKDVRDVASFGFHAGKTTLAVVSIVGASAVLVALCVASLSDI